MLLKMVRYAVANAPYDFTILQFCDFAILRFCDFAILRFCDFTILRFYELRTLLYLNLSCTGNIPEIHIT